MSLFSFRRAVAAFLCASIGLQPLAVTAAGGAQQYRVPLKTGTITASSLEIQPDPVAFGEVARRQTRTLPVRVSNTGTAVVSDIHASTNAPFAVDATGCNTLVPGQSCTVYASFSPATVGYQEAVLSIQSSTQPAAVKLSGQSVPLLESLDISSNFWNFGSWQVGETSDRKQIVVRNLGNAPVALKSIDLLPGSDGFAMESTCNALIPVGSACTVTVSFMPPALGRYIGAFRIRAADGSLRDINMVGFGGEVSDAGPKLSISSVANLGQVVPGESSEPYALVVSNLGTEPLRVTGANLSGSEPQIFRLGNGCTGDVAPFESCILTLTFTPKALGAYQADLSLESNDVRSPRQVTVYGTGVPPVEKSSLSTGVSTLEFAADAVNTRVIKRLTIKNAGPDATKLVTVYTTNASVFSASGCDQSLEAKASCDLEVTFDATSVGISYGELVLTSSGGESRTVTLLGRVSEGSVSVVPDILDFPETDVNQQSPGSELTITNQGVSPLVLTGIGIFDESLKLETGAFRQSNSCGESLASGSACKVSVRFAPTQVGVQRGNLVMTSASELVPMMTVPLVGVGRKSEASVHLSRERLDFGQQTVGKTVQGTLSVVNAGPSQVSMTGVGIQGTGFAQGNACARVLLAKEACTVQVQFKPTAEVSYDAKLTVTTSNGQTLTLPVAGEGVMGDVAAHAEVTPTSLGFGSTLVGESSLVRWLNLTNTGLSALEVSGLSVLNADGSNASVEFAQSNTCGDLLEPNNVCQIGVVFRPADTGMRSAYLSVATNDPAEPIKLVPLTGNGLAGTLEVTPTKLVLGSVAVGLVRDQSVTVTNTSQDPIQVAGIGLSAADSAAFTQNNDCSEPLGKNASCEVLVRFAPSAEGAVTGVLVIAGGDGSYRTVNLSGQGEGEPYGGAAGHLYANASLLDFSQIATGQAADQTFELRNRTGRTVTVSSIAATGEGADAFSASQDCLGILEDRTACMVKVTASSLVAGAHAATLAILSDEPEVTVGLRAQAVQYVSSGTVTVMPASLDFGAAMPDVPVHKTLRVSNAGPDAVRLTSILSSDPASFAVSAADACLASLEANQACELDVAFSPTAAGRVAGSLTLKTSLGQTVTVPLTGYGPAPEARLSPTTADFGVVEVFGASTPVQFTLSNAGDAPLVVQGIGLSANYSRETDCPATVAPGGQCSVWAVLSPTVTGIVPGVLTISTNDATRPTLQASLIGRGAEGALEAAPMLLAFARQELGETSTQAVTLRNTGSLGVEVTDVKLAGRDISAFAAGSECNQYLAPAQACTLSVSFTATTSGAHSASLVATTRTGTSLTVALTGEGPPAKLALTPSSLNFEQQPVAISSMSQIVTVSNIGAGPARVGAAQVTQGESDFGATASCPGVLPAGESCQVAVSLTPAAVGARAGLLTIASNNAAGDLVVPLSGSGVATTAAFVPATLDFGAIYQGQTSAAQTAQLRNTGSYPLVVRAVVATSDSYVQANTCGAIIPVGGACEVTVQATPRSSGTLLENLTLQTSAGNHVLALRTVVNQVTVSSVSPQKGSAVGGSELTVLGSGFDASTQVSFGGTPAAAVRVDSSSQLTVVTPVHATGVVDITFATDTAPTATVPSGFTFIAAPAVTALSPSAGTSDGSWTAELSGTELTCPMTVVVEGKEMPAMTCKGSSASFVVPARATAISGVVSVSAKTEGGTATLAGALQYEQPSPLWAVTKGDGNFGSLALNTTASRFVLLSNLAKSPAVLSDLTITGAQAGTFTLGTAGTCPKALPATVPALGGCWLELKATSGADAAVAKASLTLNAASPANGQLSVPLTVTSAYADFAMSSTTASVQPVDGSFAPIADLRPVGGVITPSSRSRVFYLNNVGPTVGSRISDATVTITGPDAELFTLGAVTKARTSGAVQVLGGALSADKRTYTNASTDDPAAGLSAYINLQIPVIFTPIGTGQFTAQLNINYNGGGLAVLPLVASVSYDATASITAASIGSAPPADFGNVSYNTGAGTVITPKDNVFYVRNASTNGSLLRVTRMSIVGEDAASFVLKASTWTGASGSDVVGAQDVKPKSMIQSNTSSPLQFTTTFKPRKLGVHRATLLVEHSGTNDTLVIPLTGNGVRDINMQWSQGSNIVPVTTFGTDVPVNDDIAGKVQKYLTLRNMGTSGQVRYTKVQLTGSDDFYISGVNTTATTHAQVGANVQSQSEGTRVVNVSILGADASTSGAATDFGVVITFKPKAEGESNATLTIFHDGPGGQSSVDLVGSGKNFIRLVATPVVVNTLGTGFNYGATKPGASRNLQLTLENVGSAGALTLNTLTLSGPDADQFVLTAVAKVYSTSTLVWSSASGTRIADVNTTFQNRSAFGNDTGALVTMQHRPTRSGTHTATLTVASNASTPRLDIPLSATMSNFADFSCVLSSCYAKPIILRLSNSNLTAEVTYDTGAVGRAYIGPMAGIPEGKWYWEFQDPRSMGYGFQFDANWSQYVYFNTDYRYLGYMYATSGLVESGPSRAPVASGIDSIAVAYDTATRTAIWYQRNATTKVCSVMMTQVYSKQPLHPAITFTNMSSQSTTLANGALRNYRCPLPEGYAPLPN